VAQAAQRRWRPAQIALAATATTIVGALTAAAVLVPGYDTQDVVRVATSVWVTRDNGQYALVNTDLNDFDAVRAVAEPSRLVQSGTDGLMFTQGLVQGWPLDAAYPLDLVDGSTDGASAIASPAGTADVSAAGEWVLYRTGLGEVFLGRLPKPGQTTASTFMLDPYADVEVPDGEDAPRYVADAVAVSTDGHVVMYSGAEHGVREFDTRQGTFQGALHAIPDAPAAGTDLVMIVVGTTWVMYAPADGLVWIEGHDSAVQTGLGADALMQDTSADGSQVLFADSTGLSAMSLDNGSVQHIADASGRPAVPVRVDGVDYAAWVDTAQATLWTSQNGSPQALDVDQDALADVRTVNPVFRTNGSRVVLTETATGMVWTMPTGALIPLVAWSALDDSQMLDGTVEVEDMLDEQPPTARNDVFGVRRGNVVMLPVLLNDSDPNKKDVLTIDSNSLSGLADTSFGSLGLVEDDQQASVTVAAASGSTTFTYAASDGAELSSPATVTLTVVPDDQNSAPVWCPMDDCTQLRPQPQVAPGGYAEVKVLPGWVDPEGDAITLADARAKDPQAPVTVVPTADGTVVIRHQDPNGGEATIGLVITVMDSYGASTEMEFDLRVTAAPSLTVKPVAVSAALGEHRTIAISDWVSGGSGSYRLVDASSNGDESLAVTPSAADSTIDVVASKPGEYTATYTVEDTATLTQQTAVLRLTAMDESRTLAAPPLTAFVRPGEDTTIDVLSSVRSSGGRVLLVQSATTSSPDLSVSVVEQGAVRVSATVTSAQPGPLGSATIVIADGTGNTVTTQLSVFLILPSHGIGPVAAPDAVSVRAGEQMDIPVLANDSAPRGERLALHPSVVGSGADGELAFASGTMLRYLAPEVPGIYTLTYSTYMESDANQTDSATLTVTVIPAGSNRAPKPADLEARVVAGRSVTIPLGDAGRDPDGDPVTVVDVTQPDAGGVASVSSSGMGVVYRAPAAGVSGGQVTFTYTVRDAQGEVGTGTVRVGVLDVTLDVAPVTYSDYVAVRTGSTTPVTLTPLANDRDPSRGELELIEVRPNAIVGSQEYERLEALIDPATSFEDGTVVLHAGDVEGTHSFIYTVQSRASFSTAQGLIVLGVSDDPAPDGMRIADTTVTAQNRHDLETGIDVVSGKVQWPTGDVTALTLELWGKNAENFTVNGWSISGALPLERTVVPFSVTGTDASGSRVTSYGFLRIPAFDDMRLQVRTGLTPLQVGEEKSVEFALRDVLQLSGSDSIEIRHDDSFAVQRTNARCVPTDGDSASYAAGREAPWTDTCSVAVRLVGQSTWSIVAVPVAIEPKDPLAILSPVSRTVTPGADDAVALIDEMISWEGGRVGDVSALHLATHYEGTAFIVTQTGDSVSIQAYADAKPGTRETIIVDSSAYGGLRSAITLVVGAALPDSPKGATFSQTCDVSRGSSCTITAVGLPNEYDPYAGKPHSGLTIASVGTSGSVECSVATITRASDTQLVATWPAGAKPFGGECTADFTVIDAQGKTGPGRVTIDVQGYPPAPQSLTTVSYGPNSVTMQVRLGDAALTRPEVTRVTVWEGSSQVATCDPSGPGLYTCVVSGLNNGEEHLFTARATNAVGDSDPTRELSTWAYDAPRISAATATPVYRTDLTNQTRGVVAISITSGPDVKSFTIEDVSTGNRDVVQREGDITTRELPVTVGNHEFVITPESQYSPPTGGTNRGQATHVNVSVAGSPIVTQPSGTASNTTITMSQAQADGNYSAKSLSLVYLVWRDNQANPGSQPPPSCTMAADGTASVSGATSTSTTSRIFAGLDENTYYRVGVCAANGFGATLAMSGSDEASLILTWVAPAPPTGSPTYTVATTPSKSGNIFTFGVTGTPSLTTNGQNEPYFRFSGGEWTKNFALNSEVINTIEASACRVWKGSGLRCGDIVPISPAAGSAPTTVTVTFPLQCVVDSARASDVTISQAARAYAKVTIADGKYVVEWSDLFGMLDPIEYAVNVCPVVDPDPDPDTDPNPDPAP